MAVVTGTRAEFGILTPILVEIMRSKDLELHIIATGMHLSEVHGYTLKDIERSGFRVDEVVDMSPCDDSEASMAKALGKGIIGITEAFERINSDIVLVLGDRSEAFAGAIAGAYTNRVVVHVHGGEVTKGCIDESIRHAVTKLAHVHFPATRDGAERIIKLGERRANVHVVGAPALDVILNVAKSIPEEVAKELGLDLTKPIILAVQHPVTTQADEAADQMRVTLAALVALHEQTVLLYPNNDAGGIRMIKVIERSNFPPYIRTYPSLPQKQYIGLMATAAVMVGNSSSGIIEAPSFGLPFVNIGMRQEGRLRGDNVIDVPHDRDAIVEAVRKALHDKAFREKVSKRRNPWGDGKAAKRIVKLLSELEITEELLQKQITY
ncbi:UDP-N-acetylglucosamine 2-epimerase [Candidatus Bathyarchaeota archaeon]|nr:UDP-N-acetylglucosamine 2-epimerase [Candidatus Bathyarchaeota archaeon]